MDDDGTPAPEAATPLDQLRDAVQQFVNDTAGEPRLLDLALVVWEEIGFDEDGDTNRRIRYSIPTDNFALSGTLGLLEAAGEYVRRDILGARTEDED